MLAASLHAVLVPGGCSSMQGFLLGPSLPMAEFEHVHSAAGIDHT